jgi:tetratricopeptide (TPR) repeat protein
MPPALGKRSLAIIFVTAVLFRILCLVVLRDHPLLRFPVVDAKLHDEWALRILAGDWLGHGPDDVFKPPLYPYLLAALYAWPGDRILLVQGFQMLLGAASCVLTALLAARLFSRSVAIVAGLVSAFYAPYVFFELQLLTPAPIVFLNLAAVFLLVRETKPSRRRVHDTAAGVLLGISAGMRPDVVVPALLCAGFLFLLADPEARRRLARRALWFAPAVMAVVLPIVVRNFIVAGAILPVSTNAGLNLYVGNAPEGAGTSAVPVGLRWERLLCEIPQPVLEHPESATAYWWRRTVERVAHDPRALLGRLAGKALAFLNGREFRNNIDFHFLRLAAWPLRIPGGQFAWIAPFGLCGLWLAGRSCARTRKRVVLLLAMPFLGYWLLGVMFFVTGRFRLPAVPFLTIAAAWFLVDLLRRLREKDTRRLMRYGGLILVAGLAVWPPWFGRPETDWARDEINLGNSLQAAGDPEGARRAYERALARRPDDPDAHYLAAMVVSARNPQAVREHLLRARTALPDSPDILLALAENHLRAGERESARAVLAEFLALETKLNLWPRRTAWAIACASMADLDSSRAAEYWRKAWTVDPRAAAEAAFVRRREPERVLATFRSEVESHPWDWYALTNYGLCLFSEGMLQESVSSLRGAVAKAPAAERTRLQLLLARVLISADRKSEAADLLDKIERPPPDSPFQSQLQQLRRLSRES